MAGRIRLQEEDELAGRMGWLEDPGSSSGRFGDAASYIRVKNWFEIGATKPTNFLAYGRGVCDNVIPNGGTEENKMIGPKLAMKLQHAEDRAIPLPIAPIDCRICWKTIQPGEMVCTTIPNDGNVVHLTCELERITNDDAVYGRLSY